MPTTLITGCDTGIGREFALQYARAGWSVVATHRDIANAIAGVEGIRNLPLDVTRPEAFVALKRALGAEPIDLLVSNAGIGLDTGRLGALDFGYVRQMLEVNTMGPLRLVETLADNVAASGERRIAAVTSRMGSIGLNLSGGHYGYRASKAGLNALMRSLAVDLFARGITVVLIHPGWVDTAGGGGGGALAVADSVASMRGVIARLGNHETGQLLSYDGTPLPW
ncbi:SDR family oxidoreductase [Aquibium sp. A9E412]|uniref:SDR family oxidoreductase n=1 Tax=Aquibium sp. A9E412 TaxID=2976767 RepID=UPI0025AECEED|nr:SDR family oxidoreductase [Aquibium sp. A9E412]MDN2564871.1 SDR family oxidoreductase [Aquibium sp. A9E412]